MKVWDKPKTSELLEGVGGTDTRERAVAGAGE